MGGGIRIACLQNMELKSMKKHTHGGKRPGSGRPAGSGKGRTAITRSVSMSEGDWNKLDQARGTESRGAYIARKLTKK